MGLKLGQVAQPLRAALTGKAASPPLFEMLALLGREESLIRLRAYAA
jgi:glutamyl-tRNA synthetase